MGTYNAYCWSGESTPSLHHTATATARKFEMTQALNDPSLHRIKLYRYFFHFWFPKQKDPQCLGFFFSVLSLPSTTSFLKGNVTQQMEDSYLNFKSYKPFGNLSDDNSDLLSHRSLKLTLNRPVLWQLVTSSEYHFDCSAGSIANWRLSNMAQG